jgi:protein ImuB
MNYAVLEIPDFSLRALLRLESGLAEKVVAVIQGEGKRSKVCHSTEAALRQGVRVGMGSVQALAECPFLDLRMPSLGAEKEASAVLLNSAWTLSPRVEQTAPGVCTVDLTGRTRSDLQGDLLRVTMELGGQGLPVRIGVADTPLTARFAAHAGTPIKWVTDSLRFLAALPVELLELTPDEEVLFATLGLRTLADVTRLPRASFSQRLGVRGDRLWSMAAGENDRPLDTATPPASFEAHIDLEHPAETIDPLLFVIRRFVDRLAAELSLAGLAAETLSLGLRLDDETCYAHSFRPPEATSKADVLFRLLENHLATVQTKSAVIGVDLSLSPMRQQHRQDGLFEAALRDPHAFWDTLARTSAVLGAAHVGTPARAPTHRPGAFVLTAPLATVPEYAAAPRAPARGPLLRRLRPPAPATVELSGGVPNYLRCAVAEGAVVAHRGPFRLSGDWWENEGWSREEWDIELGGQGLYRLLHLPAGWFVEGTYD